MKPAPVDETKARGHSLAVRVCATCGVEEPDWGYYCGKCGAPWPNSPPERARRRARRGHLVEVAVMIIGFMILLLLVGLYLTNPGFARFIDFWSS